MPKTGGIIGQRTGAAERRSGGTEGQLTDQEEKEYPLKNGGRIDGPLGNSMWESLQQLQQQKPELFASLVALVQGRAEEVPPEHIAALHHKWLVKPDGTPVQDYRDVLLSSYQETPEGPVLVNPFRLDSEDQVREIRAAETERLRRLLDMIRDEDDTPGGGRGGR